MTINVLKIGGGAGIDPTEALRNLAEHIRAGEQWILVHGASDAANTLAQSMGVMPQTLTTLNGHTSRYTNAPMLEIFCAAAGGVNTRITAALASFSVAAAGISGVSILHAERKTAIRALVNGRQVIIRDDFSGALTHTNNHLLWALLDDGITPVISPIALGSEGERLNVDGDLAAALIAGGVHADTLIILSNVPGLLRDVSDPRSLIEHIDADDLSPFQAFAHGRMKKKLIAAERATASGVRRVILADARSHAPLDAALSGQGTHILRGMLETVSGLEIG